MSEGSAHTVAERDWVWQILPQAKAALVVPKGRWCRRSELSKGVLNKAIHCPFPLSEGNPTDDGRHREMQRGPLGNNTGHFVVWSQGCPD